MASVSVGLRQADRRLLASDISLYFFNGRKHGAGYTFRAACRLSSSRSKSSSAFSWQMFSSEKEAGKDALKSDEVVDLDSSGPQSAWSRIKKFPDGVKRLYLDLLRYKSIHDASKTPLNAWTINHPHKKRKEVRGFFIYEDEIRPGRYVKNN